MKTDTSQNALDTTGMLGVVASQKQASMHAFSSTLKKIGTQLVYWGKRLLQADKLLFQWNDYYMQTSQKQ
eukprot:1005585-Amphidinium_carterae.1